MHFYILRFLEILLSYVTRLKLCIVPRRTVIQDTFELHNAT